MYIFGKNLKSNKMKKFKTNPIKKLKSKYPNAQNITFGSNNITTGFWFENGENAKHRTFYAI